jgi:DNA invertase Pin-like site-specific DNA recombinase
MRTPRVRSVPSEGSVQTAIAYIRVSTEEQAREGVSLAAQEARARAYCVSAGLELKKIIREEGVSAGKPLADRPAGRVLLGKCGAGHIVALKLDRLFRNAEDALRVTRGWDQAGVALHIIDMGGQAFNTASAMGRMMLTMMAAFAELERNLVSERTATALAHLKASGKVYGAVPYGSQASEDGNLFVHSDEMVVLARIGEWREAGVSLRAIAEKLNAEGVGCKRGGEKWYASTVRSVLNQVQQYSSARAAA